MRYNCCNTVFEAAIHINCPHTLCRFCSMIVWPFAIGNKFGEPVVAGFARSFGQQIPFHSCHRCCCGTHASHSDRRGQQCKCVLTIAALQKLMAQILLSNPLWLFINYGYVCIPFLWFIKKTNQQTEVIITKVRQNDLQCHLHIEL